MQQLAMDDSKAPDVGSALKVLGQERAAARAGDRWWQDCILALEAYLTVVVDTEFAVEHFRAWAVPRVIDPPPSHKVWGTVPRRAIAAGIIEPIKDADGNPVYVPSRSPATHCHPVRMYRRKAAR